MLCSSISPSRMIEAAKKLFMKFKFHRGNKMKKHGFTLIELLVVIAIIAILAAILFPVFARARSQARKTMCTSNMKQMALATMMYVQDHDETFPPRYGSQSTGLPSWIITIQPYAKNQKI